MGEGIRVENVDWYNSAWHNNRFGDAPPMCKPEGTTRFRPTELCVECMKRADDAQRESLEVIRPMPSFSWLPLRLRLRRRATDA